MITMSRRGAFSAAQVRRRLVTNPYAAQKPQKQTDLYTAARLAVKSVQKLRVCSKHLPPDIQTKISLLMVNTLKLLDLVKDYKAASQKAPSPTAEPKEPKQDMMKSTAEKEPLIERNRELLSLWKPNKID